MSLSILLPGLTLGFFISLLIAYLLIKFGHRFKLIDTPNLRSSHHTPTPSGGGVSFVITFLILFVISTFFDMGGFTLPSSVVTAILIGGGGLPSLDCGMIFTHFQSILELPFML